MQAHPPVCVDCKHLNTEEGWYCAAFKGRIPIPILIGENDHREPYPGDNGIQFEPLDEGEPNE